MNILIAAIGKFKPGDNESLLIEEYLKRMTWHIKLASNQHENTKAGESRALLALSKPRYLIALDVGGKEMSSKEFAGLLSQFEVKSTNNLAFAIGGAHGHDESLIKQANLVLSLSKMTLPHKLARVFLVEQLYRAHSIMRNHPYNT
jgi:23S rRNA (pseudouridine1915-N3)-methyltransferase